MKVTQTELPGVRLIEPRVFEDSRGFFFEIWNQNQFEKAGIPTRFVQDNLSSSIQNTIRGLHYQYPYAQAKLVYVLEGEVFDVAVDIRSGSPTFGKWVGAVLSAQNKKLLYVPEGFAHGFCVLSKRALFAYKCSEFYNSTAEGAVNFQDTSIAIQWPIRQGAILSDRDQQAPLLRDIPTNRLPKYTK